METYYTGCVLCAELIPMSTAADSRKYCNFIVESLFDDEPGEKKRAFAERANE